MLKSKCGSDNGSSKVSNIEGQGHVFVTDSFRYKRRCTLWAHVAEEGSWTELIEMLTGP